MAGTVTVSSSLSVVNGFHRDNPTIPQARATQTLVGRAGSTHALTDSESAIDLGSLTKEGWGYLANLTEAGEAGENEIIWGPDSTGMVAAGRLKPGEGHPIRFEPGVSYKAKMAGAGETGQLDVAVYED